jgi:hypothetical protein
MSLDKSNREVNKNTSLSLKEWLYFFFIAHPPTKNKSTVYKYERKQRGDLKEGFIKKYNQSVEVRLFGLVLGVLTYVTLFVFKFF